MKGLVITTENKMQVREFDEPAYETIGKAVGGWIEVVHPKGLPGPFCMVVNEEGLLHQLPDNPRASSLYIFGDRSVIVGNAALMAGRGEDLIGFPNPVCRTICDEWELEMEDGAWND